MHHSPLTPMLGAFLALLLAACGDDVGNQDLSATAPTTGPHHPDAAAHGGTTATSGTTAVTGDGAASTGGGVVPTTGGAVAPATTGGSVAPTGGSGAPTAGSVASTGSGAPSTSGGLPVDAGSATSTGGSTGTNDATTTGDSGDAGVTGEPVVDRSAPLTAVAFFPSKDRESTCADASISIQFNRTPILPGGGSIQIHEASGAVFDSVTSRPRDGLYFSDLVPRTTHGKRFDSDVLDVVFDTVVFHPKGPLQPGKTYYVTVDEGMITDELGTRFSVEGGDEWTFTVRPAAPPRSDAYTLAADGSGDYCSLEGVLQALPDAASTTRVITVEPGVYPGIVRMSDSRVHFLGKGVDRSVIAPKNSTYMNDDREGIELSGSDVTFENLTIFNTYLKDSNGQQAEALYVTSRSQRVFLDNVHLRSHQDTLRVDGDTVYMKGGKISGSTDPLWGTGTFYCDGCELSSRTSGHAFVVARSTKGFAMVNCRVTKESDGVRSTYLAQFHRGAEPGKIAFIGCEIDDHIVGWRDPGRNEWYEYDNTHLQTGSPVQFDGMKPSPGSRVLEEASSVQSWLGWTP